MRTVAKWTCWLVFSACAHSGDETGNRLTYLDGSDPYYPHRDFPRLVTPQWVGEVGVEAVVVLAGDDLVNAPGFMEFLAPTVERLEAIDGRAPISLMCNRLDMRYGETIQDMLAAGMSFEAHSYGHPCPILQQGDLAAGKAAFDSCVDDIAEIPGNTPVAWRTPCIDSMNSLSPRFFAEIFNQVTLQGNTLSVDSSVFSLVTPLDEDIPREWLFDAEGRGINTKYVPEGWLNYVEDYPYPYVIGRLCWELPCGMPSDWQGSQVLGDAHPALLRDWKRMIDIAVRKRGTFTMVFHAAGWCGQEQVAELVDYAHETHGAKVKFLTFREASERIEGHLLADVPLRRPDGGDHGVRLLDLNDDGFMDVVIGNPERRLTRVWDPAREAWTDGTFPVAFYDLDAAGRARDAGVRFGIVGEDRAVVLLARNEVTAGAWAFRDGAWTETGALLTGLELDGEPIWTSVEGRDRGVRLRDLDRDGQTELLIGNEEQRATYRWNADAERWVRLPFALPEPAAFVDADGYDRGLRFADLDGDGYDDVLYSNETEYSLHLFTSTERGWDRQVKAGPDGPARALPMFVRGRSNNGAWFFGDNLIVQNEDTAALDQNVDHRSFEELVAAEE